MAAKKFNLTKDKDHFDGSKGNDEFVAKPGTLGTQDVLDGRGGLDKITAILGSSAIAPTMKSIETGIFTVFNSAAASLDLDHAAQMKAVTVEFAALGGSVDIQNAAALASLSVQNLVQGTATIAGIDATTITAPQISLKGLAESTVTLSADGGGDFDRLKIKLDDVDDTTLSVDGSAHVISVNSSGKTGNVLAVSLAKPDGAERVVVTGKAGVILAGGFADMNALTEFDASKATGGVGTLLDSAALVTVKGSGGSDDIRLHALGGTTASKASVELGLGNDSLDVSAMAIDATKMHFIGGKGMDTLVVGGSPSGIDDIAEGFETLGLRDAAGTYVLGSEWHRLKLLDGSVANDGIIIDGKAGLTAITGSDLDDHLQITGLASGKKTTVDLGKGDDFVNLENLDLETAQSFKGGDGNDGFSINGNASLSQMFKGFEYVYLVNPNGTIDFQDTGIGAVILTQVTTATSFDSIKSGALVQVLASQTSLLNVHVENADKTTTDSFRVELYNSANLGNTALGFGAADLSILDIASSQGSHVFYLSDVGSASDDATLNISGDSHLTLFATSASKMHIDQIISTNTAGFDMLGLLDGKSALAAGGVTIAGGAGDDVLVGGDGADVISTGGGNNTVHGSSGADAVTLEENSGLDVLIFNKVGESSASGGRDVVENFGPFDSIDISAFADSVVYLGNVTDLQAGQALLSGSHASAFFSTSDHTLYVDLDHNKLIDPNSDFSIQLDGVTSFSAANLLS